MMHSVYAAQGRPCAVLKAARMPALLNVVRSFVGKTLFHDAVAGDGDDDDNVGDDDQQDLDDGKDADDGRSRSGRMLGGDVHPDVLQQLFERRKQVKEQLKRETRAEVRDELDIKYQAIKLLMNSMYESGKPFVCLLTYILAVVLTVYIYTCLFTRYGCIGGTDVMVDADADVNANVKVRGTAAESQRRRRSPRTSGADMEGRCIAASSPSPSLPAVVVAGGDDCPTKRICGGGGNPFCASAGAQYASLTASSQPLVPLSPTPATADADMRVAACPLPAPSLPEHEATCRAGEWRTTWSPRVMGVIARPLAYYSPARN